MRDAAREKCKWAAARPLRGRKPNCSTGGRARALRAHPGAHAVYAGGTGGGALAQARPMRQRRRERAYRAQRRRRHKGDGQTFVVAGGGRLRLAGVAALVAVQAGAVQQAQGGCQSENLPERRQGRRSEGLNEEGGGSSLARPEKPAGAARRRDRRQQGCGALARARSRQHSRR